MAKPIVNSISAFDAIKEHYISFVWNGNVAYNNKIYIYDAQTLAIVYEHQYPYNYYKLQHVIPANTLQNGKQYAISVEVIDAYGDISELSDKVYFQCLSTPTLDFANIHDKDEINMGTFTAILLYSGDL